MHSSVTASQGGCLCRIAQTRTAGPDGLVIRRRPCVALMFVRIVDAFEEPRLSIAWPVSLSMDLAIVYFVARLIFRTHPVIPFLLLLGIASDALGFLSLAVLNQTREVHLVSGALILAGAIGIAAGLRWSRVRSFWPYLLAAGSVSWFGFLWMRGGGRSRSGCPRRRLGGVGMRPGYPLWNPASLGTPCTQGHASQ